MLVVGNPPQGTLENPNSHDGSCSFSFTDRTQITDCAVHLHELFGREGLRPLQDLTCALVLPHLLFLFIAQCHDTQRENLINLTTIEEGPWAFWSNLRIVI